MRKSERLFHILNVLRSRRTAITAEHLADTLEISKRTIYRDIQSLILSGVPIEGGAGVGYLLQRNIDLPPLMFDRQELEAVLLGARMVRAWSDKQLAVSANSALGKIMAVVPDDVKESPAQSFLHVPSFGITEEVSSNSEIIREAIAQRRVLQISYSREDGERSTRCVHPLGLFFWGKAWTLVAWCELRGDYRSFRLDRASELRQLSRNFELEATKSLDHFMALQKEKYRKEIAGNANCY